MNAVTRQKIGSCQLHTDLQVSFLFQKKKMVHHLYCPLQLLLCSRVRADVEAPEVGGVADAVHGTSIGEGP